MFNKSNCVTYICLFAISLGFTGIHEGYIDIGRNLINTTISGYFGYALKDNKNYPELLFLLVIVIGAYITYFISTDVAFSESIGVVSTAVGGYLGYLNRDNKEV